MNTAEAELESAIQRIMHEQNVTRKQAEPVAQASLRLEEAKARHRFAHEQWLIGVIRKHRAATA